LFKDTQLGSIYFIDKELVNRSRAEFYHYLSENNFIEKDFDFELKSFNQSSESWNFFREYEKRITLYIGNHPEEKCQLILKKYEAGDDYFNGIPIKK
jgi:hypothetical protein